MTYCIGMNLAEGLLLVSDSRTNAGVDNIARFEKMKVFERPGERVLATLSAGNLSVTQNALSLLELHARDHPDAPSIWNVQSIYEVADLLGRAMREVRERDEKFLRERGVDPSATFILGGQIKGEPPRLFMVYSEGNFIEAMTETPFFQIGEIKYGRSVLNRLIRRDTPLDDAAKCAMVSFDATMGCNLSVGTPLDLLIYRRDSLQVGVRRRLLDDDPWMQSVRQTWGEGLHALFRQLPDGDWVQADSARGVPQAVGSGAR